MDTPTPGAAPEAAASLRQHADHVIELTVAMSLEIPGVRARLGPEPEEMLAAGLRFTTDGIATAMDHGTTELLDDQLQWAVARLPHDGVPPEDLLHRLGLYRQATEQVLPEEHSRRVGAYIDWMTLRLQELMAPTS